MKKLLLSMFISSIFIINVYAESNGVFLGAGIGIENNKEKTISMDQKTQQNIGPQLIGGLVFGYKHFIGDSRFGLRYYVSADTNLPLLPEFLFSNEKIDDVSEAGWSKYAFNIDALINFTPTKSFVGFGVFVGAYAGITNWNVKGSDIKLGMNETLVGINKNTFGAGANLGARLTIGDGNAIEIASKIPIKASEISQSKMSNNTRQDYSTKEAYDVQLRYIYTF